ncbi:MAG: pyridoxamine 5'-phosphate oxidase family protein, partial [Candidatus Hydrothermae bacterium]|nr:pyridoxamine 5'-phosphate oxidase family protein [Candidatus Hydrothermae bacterium]
MSLKAVIRERLEETSILTLAVQDDKGPWSVPVIFAYEERPDGFALYFMSRTETRHVRALRRTPWAAASLHPGTTRPLRGLQMEGPVRPVPLHALPRVLHLYGRRFPRALPRIPRDLLDAGKLRFFLFHPHWFGVLDEQRFGW